MKLLKIDEIFLSDVKTGPDGSIVKHEYGFDGVFPQQSFDEEQPLKVVEILNPKSSNNQKKNIYGSNNSSVIANISTTRENIKIWSIRFLNHEGKTNVPSRQNLEDMRFNHNIDSSSFVQDHLAEISCIRELSNASTGPNYDIIRTGQDYIISAGKYAMNLWNWKTNELVKIIYSTDFFSSTKFCSCHYLREFSFVHINPYHISIIDLSGESHVTKTLDVSPDEYKNQSNHYFRTSHLFVPDSYRKKQILSFYKDSSSDSMFEESLDFIIDKPVGEICEVIISRTNDISFSLPVSLLSSCKKIQKDDSGNYFVDLSMLYESTEELLLINNTSESSIMNLLNFEKIGSKILIKFLIGKLSFEKEEGLENFPILEMFILFDWLEMPKYCFFLCQFLEKIQNKTNLISLFEKSIIFFQNNVEEKSEEEEEEEGEEIEKSECHFKSPFSQCLYNIFLCDLEGFDELEEFDIVLTRLGYYNDIFDEFEGICESKYKKYIQVHHHPKFISNKDSLDIVEQQQQQQHLFLEDCYENLLEDLYRTKKYWNVILVSKKQQTKQFHAHKEVLMIQSSFFFRVFKFPGLESEQSEKKDRKCRNVIIENLDHRELEILLEYVYLKKLPRSLDVEESIFSLYVQAEMYFEKSLKLEIQEYLKGSKSKFKRLMRRMGRVFRSQDIKYFIPPETKERWIMILMDCLGIEEKRMDYFLYGSEEKED